MVTVGCSLTLMYHVHISTTSRKQLGLRRYFAEISASVHGVFPAHLIVIGHVASQMQRSLEVTYGLPEYFEFLCHNPEIINCINLKATMSVFIGTPFLRSSFTPSLLPPFLPSSFPPSLPPFLPHSLPHYSLSAQERRLIWFAKKWMTNPN